MGRESANRSNYFSVDRWVDETIDTYRSLTLTRRGAGSSRH